MAKRKRAATDKKVPHSSVHICFERILPDEVDSERAVRRVLREHMAMTRGGDLRPEESLHVARMALIDSKKWASGETLKCRFLDGSATMRKKVEAVAHRWEDHAKIKFKFVASGAAEIRVSFFADTGSWSAVGRDALNAIYFPLHQPTMNYGWLRDDTNPTEYSRVVLHEFGHALGCIHEHQSPTFDRKWDKQAVLTYFQGPPNFWSPADIEHNVLKKYSPHGVPATRFDPDSIMLYSFDAALFADGKGPTNSNSKLSATDIRMIQRMYH
jgi:serralysin